MKKAKQDYPYNPIKSRWKKILPPANISPEPKKISNRFKKQKDAQFFSGLHRFYLYSQDYFYLKFWEKH